MIFIGVLTGLMSGVALPIHMLLFGEIINRFVYHQIATDSVRPLLREFVMNDTLNTMNITFEDVTCTRGTTDSIIANISGGGEDVYLCSSGEGGDIFENVVDFICDPRDMLLDEMVVFAYAYIGIAVGVLVTALISNALLNLSAYRQTRRMRLAFFRNVLHQEIGWFDTTDSAELSTRLAE